MAGVKFIFFPPSGFYGVVFWICAGHRWDNTEIFVVAVAEQGLHRTKGFSGFHSVTLVRKLGVSGRLEGDTDRTCDPKGP